MTYVHFHSIIFLSHLLTAACVYTCYNEIHLLKNTLILCGNEVCILLSYFISMYILLHIYVYTTSHLCIYMWPSILYITDEYIYPVRPIQSVLERNTFHGMQYQHVCRYVLCMVMSGNWTLFPRLPFIICFEYLYCAHFWLSYLVRIL